MNLKESALYQAILHKGRAREVRKILLLQGRRRFGEPTPAISSALEDVTDLSRLEEVAMSLPWASDWAELLAWNGLKPQEKKEVPLAPGWNSTLWHWILNSEETPLRQAILEEGAFYEAQHLLLLQGRSCLGEPTPAELAALNVGGLARQEELAVRLPEASSWKELLGWNRPRRRRRSEG